MAEAKTKIGNAEFTLTWTEDIAVMEKSHRTRALKLIDIFRAAGENSAPKVGRPKGSTNRRKAEPAGDPEHPVLQELSAALAEKTRAEKAVREA